MAREPLSLLKLNIFHEIFQLRLHVHDYISSAALTYSRCPCPNAGVQTHLTIFDSTDDSIDPTCPRRLRPSHCHASIPLLLVL
jgi:hypothetical protein